MSSSKNWLVECTSTYGTSLRGRWTSSPRHSSTSSGGTYSLRNTNVINIKSWRDPPQFSSAVRKISLRFIARISWIARALILLAKRSGNSWKFPIGLSRCKSMRKQEIRKMMTPWATFWSCYPSPKSQSSTSPSRNLCFTPCSMALTLPSSVLSPKIINRAHCSTTSRRLCGSWDISTVTSTWPARRQMLNR